MFLPWVIIGSLLLINNTFAQSCTPSPTCGTSQKYGYLAADQSTSDYFYIGGIFGVHEAGKTHASCGNLRESGLQNLEAFMWAVKTFPDRYPNHLPNIKIGGLAFDSCGSVEGTKQQILNLQNCVVSYGTPTVIEPDKVLAFVGVDQNQEAVEMAEFLSKRKMTLISHAATDSKLSDNTAFPFFLRTVPSDEEEMLAIVDVLKKNEWLFVQVVKSDNEYGEIGMEAFKRLATKEGICMVTNQTIPVNPSEDDMNGIMEHLLEKKEAKVVVIIAEESGVKQMLEAGKRFSSQGELTMFGTNKWGTSQTVVQGVEDVAQGSVTVAIDTTLPGLVTFVNYIKTLKPENNNYNPWFKEFWQEEFNCYLQGEPQNYQNECNTSTQSLSGLNIDPFVPYTIKAVDAAIIGIADAIQSSCPSTNSLCMSFMNSANKLDNIHTKIKQVDIPNLVQFDRDTGNNLVSRYDVYNYRPPGGNCAQYCYTLVGFYDVSLKSTVFRGEIFTYDHQGNIISDDATHCPSYPCTVCGLTETTTSVGPFSTADSLEAAPAAASEEAPVRLRDESWVVALLVLTVIGILVVFGIEIYILLKVSGSPFVTHIKNIILGQLLLLGLLLCYATLFAFVVSPTTESCGILRFCVGVCFAFCYAILLVKLMILYSSKSTYALKGIYQGLMLFFIWMVQIAIDTEWLILRPPGVLKDNNNDVWMCKEGFEPHVQSLVYLMILIVITTILAIKTHSISSNYREGLFIGLACGLTIPIWLIWILLGLLHENKDFQDPAMAFGLWITVTLILLLMFVPKVKQLHLLEEVEGMYETEDFGDGYAPSVVAPSIVHSLGGTPSLFGGLGGGLGGSSNHYNSQRSLAKPESVILVNGGLYSQPEPRTLDYETNPDSLYLKHPGSTQHFSTTSSVKSAPYGYSLDRSRRMYVSPVNNYDGHHYSTVDSRRARSEYNYNIHYATNTRPHKSSRPSSNSSTMKKAKSLQDLGSL